MKNPYDCAHDLVKSIRESREYQEYSSKLKFLKNNPKDYEMVTDLKKRQFELERKRLSGEILPEDEQKKFQELANIAMMNPQIASYMQAEMSFMRIMGDIYKIVGEGLELDLGFLK